MNLALKILGGVLSLLVIGIFLSWPIPDAAPVPQRAPQQLNASSEPGYNFQDTVAGRILNNALQTPNQQGPTLGEPVTPGLSPAVRDLPPAEVEPALERELNPRQNPDILRIDPNNPDPYDTGEEDPLVRRSHNQASQTPGTSLTFEGINTGGGVPPDTIGDVGPNHYVQMVNVRFAIYDKSGNLLAGPTNINQLWQGQGNDCAANNDGDPIVVYDRQADRWLLSQFFGAASNGLCVAISQTPDPTGAYYLYQFNTPEFPDYFKIGVWPDAYYVSANESSYTAYALDRTNMLLGNAARPFVRFSGQTNFLLPSDVDGSTPPPANSPNYFFTFKDNSFHGGADRLEVFAFSVDFDTPANSSFNLVATIPVASFTYTVCGFFVFDCVPQPGTGQGLDALSEWPMWRLQYRNFGTHQTLVSNFTVDVGSDRAGIRWFELRKSGAGLWTLYQEGTHAPGNSHRWTGSAAMDKDGNIALGYSVSSSSVNPSIRYATRAVTDTLGTLQTEATLQAGGGAQTTSFARWGDYSSMNVDPSDDCTFWYTNEYYSTTSAASWQTRVGVFKIPSCETGAAAISVQPSNLSASLPPDTTSMRTLTLANPGTADLTWSIVEDNKSPVEGNGTPERLGPTTPTKSQQQPDPSSTVLANVVADPSFELGTPNLAWTEASSNFGTPICDVPSCGTGTGTGPRTGSYWVWFGGVSGMTEEGSVAQTVTISTTATELTFYLEQILCDSAADFMEVLIDGNQLFLTDGSSSLCGNLGYTRQTVNVSAFADGGTHTLEFHSRTVSNNGGLTNFFVDDVSIDEPTPACTSPSDIPWLSVAPSSGTTSAGGSTNIDVIYDTTGLATGQYNGTLCIDHNAPSGQTQVPVSLTVADSFPLYLPTILK